MREKTLSGFFGQFGGRYVAEVLQQPLENLQRGFEEAMRDHSFIEELKRTQLQFIGRPTPLMYADRVTERVGGARIYIKLEGLAQTGAHKINNACAQALLAKRMGKSRIIAETGAGQHGVATASACARLGMSCEIYMGEVDMRRQYPNVFWMQQYGAKVIPVKEGARTLKDAVNAALRDWSGTYESTHYLLGSALGPSPYPDMVREFQSVIGQEVKEQTSGLGLDVAALIACVGGGSNAMGLFAPYLEDPSVRLIGSEAGGRGNGTGQHASRMGEAGRTGIVQGYKSRFLLDPDGQVLPTHSISAGLDYPGIGPQLAHLGKTGRVQFLSITDRQALEAFSLFASCEGICFALESSHAAAAALQVAREYGRDKAIVVNMSGRGDKDIFITAPAIDQESWKQFLREEAIK